MYRGSGESVVRVAISPCSSFMFFIVVCTRISLQSSCKINDQNLTLISMVLSCINKQGHEKKRIHGKGPLKEV